MQIAIRILSSSAGFGKYAPFGTWARAMVTTPRANPFILACPSRDILELIGSKWSMLLICALRNGPIRTGALRREVQGISQKMLTQTLRDLERHGILERIDHAETPPRVEYRLTPLGQSLSTLVLQIEAWVMQNYSQMTRAVRRFNAPERAR
jgi:DNA-binding HxlR family transcriptional regulator